MLAKARTQGEKKPPIGRLVCWHPKNTKSGYIMKTLESKGTRVKVERKIKGVAEIEFTGLVSDATFGDLVPSLVRDTSGEKALFVRMDRCITAMSPWSMEPIRAFHDYYSPPGCIIVRRDQWQGCTEYARMLASINVRRLVFLQEQIELALAWVRRQAATEARSRGLIASS